MQGEASSSAAYEASTEIQDKYRSIFAVEVESWCYAFSRFPGELSQELIYRVVKEMAPAFRAAVANNYVFDILDTAGKIHRGIQGFLPLKEVVFVLLVNLPAPYGLDEEEQYALAQIIDQAEQEFGDVLSHLESKWRRDRGLHAA